MALYTKVLCPKAIYFLNITWIKVYSLILSPEKNIFHVSKFNHSGVVFDLISILKSLGGI